MRHDTEADFSRYLIGKLRQGNFDVTRLESHGTGAGIPDMFVQGNGFDFFAELKNSKRFSGKVAWRPGQQAWFANYRRCHAYEVHGVTLISSERGLYVVPMDKFYEDNKPDVRWFFADGWVKMMDARCIRTLFWCVTRNWRFILDDGLTYAEALRRFWHIFCDKMGFPGNGTDFDPDRVWNSGACYGERLDYTFDADVFRSVLSYVIIDCMRECRALA